jgi:hypothetical protein
MIMKTNKILAVLLMIAAGVVATACFEKYDEDSYRPTFTIGGFSATDEIKSANLVSYFDFEDALTDVKSGGAGTNKGTTFVNGFKGRAINFNAANKTYVVYDNADVVSQLGSFTISYWVNPTFVDTDANNSIDGILGLVNIANANDFWGYLDWFVENNSNNDGAKIVVHINPAGDGETWMSVDNYKNLFGTWSNHTLTYDATSGKVIYYINGSKAAEATAGWTGPASFAGAGPMVFGAVHFQTTPSLSNHGNESWASWLTGQMDELRVYDAALTQAEVGALVVLQGKGK